MPKPLSKQSKEMIVSLISYFERERDNNATLLPLNAVREVILIKNILGCVINLYFIESSGCFKYSHIYSE